MLRGFAGREHATTSPIFLTMLREGDPHFQGHKWRHGEVSYLSKAVRMGWVCAGYFCCITNHPKLTGIKQKCFIMFMESVGQHNERE